MARRRRWMGERGSIAPLVPIVVLAFFMLGGLIVDGSRDLNARAEAQAYAEEAARAGATAVDLTSNDLTLVSSRAKSQVHDYCVAVMASNDAVNYCRFDGFTDATICGGRRVPIVVNAVVKMTINTTLLGIVGLRDLSTTRRAKARPFEGTTAANAC